MCVGSSGCAEEVVRTGTVIVEWRWDLGREPGRCEDDKAAFPASILLSHLSVAAGHNSGDVYAHVGLGSKYPADILCWHAPEFRCDGGNRVWRDVDEGRTGKFARELDCRILVVGSVLVLAVGVEAEGRGVRCDLEHE